MKKRYIFNKVPGLPITRLDSDILLALAKEGPLNRYQLASKLRKPYTSIRGSIRRLLRLRLVEISSEEKAPTGLPKPNYQLTIGGLHCVFRVIETPEEREQIASRYSFLCPLVLGKWFLFRREGVEDIALEQFRFATSSFAYKLPADLTIGEPLEGYATEADRIAYNFYNPLFFSFPHSRITQFYKVVGKDPETREFVKNLLQKLATYHQRLSEWLLKLRSEMLSPAGGTSKSRRAPSEGRDDTSTQKERR